MNGKDAAFYTVRVNGELGENKFFFATTATKNTELGRIKLMCNAAQTVAVKRIVTALDSTNKDSVIINMFGVTEPLTSQVNADNLALAFYNLAKESTNTFDSAEKFRKAIETAVHLVAMNEGKGDPSLYGSELGVSEDIIEIYSKEVSADAKADFVNTFFKGKSFFTTKDAKKAYEDGVAFSYANSIDSLADVTAIIEKYGKEIGVDMSDYKDLKSTEKQKLCEFIADKNSFASLSDLAKAVNEKVKDIISDRKSSGGGSSGGGGGGSMSAGSTGFSPVVAPETIKGEGFSDMAGSEWAQEAVEALSNKGVVTGVGSNMYAPTKEITREEMLTMLLRAYNVDVKTASTDKFADVKATDWFAPYVAKALEIGVTSGVSDTEFGAGKKITRQEAAVMAARIAKYFGAELKADTEVFTDDGQIADWAKTAVYELKNAGVIGGIGDGSFAPAVTCTRAQAAVIIYQLIK